MDIFYLAPEEPFHVTREVQLQFPLFQLRKLDNFCIIFVIKGTACIEVDFRRFEIEEKNLLILCGNMFFQCLEISKDFTASYITFVPAIWLEITVSFEPSFFAFLKEYPHSPTLPDERVQKLHHMLCASEYIYREKENSFRLKIFKNFLQNFLLEIYDKAKVRILNRNTSNTNRQEELFEKFIMLLLKNSSIRCEVQFYADELCITTRYLSTVVQRMTGVTPKDIIDTRCIQEIKMLLCTTNDSIQEIAFRLNFPDQSFFARYFKRNTGMSPVEYRKSRGISVI